ncbi:MAG: hypothetical protein AAFY60_03105, partial [Myxococcota bacterium]
MWRFLCVAIACLISCAIPKQVEDPFRPDDGYLFTTGPYLLLGGPGEVFVAIKAELTEAPRVSWWVE